MKKKLSLILAIVLLISVCALGFHNLSNAYAADNEDFVRGESNLNNTEENSAKVGDTLILPEKGWKRYDDSNSKLTYVDYFFNDSFGEYYEGYNKTGHQCGTNPRYNPSSNDKVSFEFYGSKFRIIGTLHYYEYSNNIEVKIDGHVVDHYSCSLTEGTKFIAITYEKLNLDYGIHNVEISCINKTVNGQVIDAVDVDGYLIDDNPPLADSIEINKTSLELNKEASEKLTATVKPDNAINKDVKWTSSDESIATVDNEGNVTAVNSGNTTITATVMGTELSATCNVTVIDPSKPEPATGKAILSISLVDGKTKDYDVSMETVNKFVDWYNNGSPTTFQFDKIVNPYKSVKEFLVYDKITSFEIKEYE